MENQVVDTTYFRLLAVAARLGIPRLLGYAGSIAAGLPPREFEEAVALYHSSRHIDGIPADGRLGDSAARLLGPGEDLGDRPLVVLSAGEPNLDFDAVARPRLTAAQARMAALSSRGAHRVVAGADHYTIVTQRDHAMATVDAVRAVTEQVGARTGEPWRMGTPAPGGESEVRHTDPDGAADRSARRCAAALERRPAAMVRLAGAREVAGLAHRGRG